MATIANNPTKKKETLQQTPHYETKIDSRGLSSWHKPEMASTGVLPFIRGVDLSGNDFKVRLLKTNVLLLFFKAIGVE